MKVIFKLFLAFLTTIIFYNAKAQAPNISYNTQTLYVGKAISGISPVNTGGSVPVGYNPHFMYFTTADFGGDGVDLIASSAGVYHFVDRKLYKTSNTVGGSVAIAGGNVLDTVDGKGAAAGFRQPDHIVMDAAGNIYVADNNYLDPVNCKIRKVTPKGVVTTLAKNLAGIGSMAIAPDGTIYCYTSDGLLKVTSAGAVSILQKNFQVSNGEMPEINSIAVDNSGNIFLSDYVSQRILKVTPAGMVSIFAGSEPGDVDGMGTAAKLGNVGMMAFDNKGVLWYNDVDNGKFKKITPDGMVSTVAEGGLYNENNQNSSYGFDFKFSIDKQGTIFFFFYNHINILQLSGYSIEGDLPKGLKLDPDGKITGTPTELSGPVDVFITATNSYGKSTAKITLEVVAPAEPPVITSFSPKNGVAADYVQIIGNNLLNLSAVKVGGKPAVDFGFESPTKAWFRVPVGAESGEVTVSTSYGTHALDGFIIIQPPVVNLVTPLTGKKGDKITVKGANLTYVNDVVVGDRSTGSPKVISDSEIEFTLGNMISGDVTVVNRAGRTKYPGFIFINPPSVTSFSPSTAPGGTTVTINGKDFDGTTGVKFGNTAAASFTVESSNIIKAVVGSGSTGDVSVTTPAGTSSISGFYFQPPPTITNVSPVRAGAGSFVTVYGSNLYGAVVSVGGVLVTSISYQSDSYISFLMPAGVSSGEVKVTSVAGTTVWSGFTYVPAPQITSFSPATAGAGEHVIINGQNFTYVTSVSIGGVGAQFTVVSPTVIDAIVGQAVNGTISVRSVGGEATSTGFSYKGAIVTAFAPVSAGKGETVTITGKNFDGASKVTFGGVDAQSFTVVSATEIKAVVGTGTSGAVGVTTGFGSGYLAGFSHPGPSITSFSPTYAGALSTTPIIITGNNFTGATAVSFGGVAAMSFTVTSATTISAIPANSASGDVEVTTTAGTIRRTGFTWVQPPVITSFTPTSQKTGGNITITGSNFYGVTGVKLGGVAAQFFNVNSPTSITAYIGNAASGDVMVATVGGTVSLPGFTFTSPAITSISPSAAGAGQTVTINGSNLSAIQQVKFGGVNAASFTIVSPTEIKAVLGTGALGSVTISGPSGSLDYYGFTYVYPAQLYSVEPKQGGTGTEITINGYNLAEATEVAIGGTPVNIISKNQNIIKVKALSGVSGTINVKTPVSNLSIDKFEWFPAPTITSISPATSNYMDTIVVTGTNLTNITSVGFGAAAPYSYYKGVSPTQLKVVNTNGGTGSITVTTPGGSATIGGYVFIPPPAITSFSVAGNGPGAVITINGKNFNNVNEVSFGGVIAKSFTVVSPTVITAIPGVGANGEIVVKTRGGTASIAGYLYNIPPYITSFFPTGGTKGTLVTIMGTHFNSNPAGNTVFFGSVKGEVKSVSADKMEVIAPAGAGGLLMVVNTETNLSAYSNLPFNIKKAYTDSNPFPKKHEVGFGSDIYQYAVADFDNDGKLDVFAATNDSLIVLQNSGGSLVSSVFGKRFSVERLRWVNSIVTGDVDGDGRIDIMFDQGPSEIFLRNTTVGSEISFEAQVFETMRSDGRISSLRDIDLDGRPEISGGYQFQNLTKNGMVSFGPLFYLSTYTSDNAYSTQYTDIDGDGRPDAVYGNSNYHYRGIVWQNKTVPGVLSSNYFTSDYMGSLTQMFRGGQVYTADFDGDGKVDVMQKSDYVYGEAYWVSLNKATLGTVNNSSFQPFVKVLEAGEILAFADVNGDNMPDAIYQRYDTGLYVAINKSTIGNVVFAEPVKLISANRDQYFLNLTVQDIDGDGRNDLLVMDNSGRLLIYHNSTGLKPSLLKFPPIAAHKYGDADFALPATSENSRVPLTYTTDKPEIATVKDGIVHILKSGTVLVGVTQANDYEYDGLTIQQTLVIEKAPLTLIPDNITRKAGEPNPPLVGTAKGFVNNETTNNLTKVPVWTTTATDNSPAGVYDIVGSGGEAENYTFVYSTGKLTVLKNKAVIAFPSIAARIYGDADFGIGAGSTNADVPLTYTIDNPQVATIFNNKLHILKAGTVKITVGQDGNSFYEAAESVQQTLVINKAALAITADDKTRMAGKPDPAFTVIYEGFVKNEAANALTQLPVVTTTANAASSAGVYDLIPSGALSDNYNLTYKYGKLTITPALDNLKISATDVTCKGQGNGMVTVIAKQTASYTAVLTGNSLNKIFNFTTNLNIENLLPGTYNVCVSDAALPGQKQCFNLTIAEPKDLSVYATVKQNTSLLNVSLAGGSQYQVTLNGVMYSTRNNSITLELNRGSNKLEVVTDKECQGKVEQIINYSGNPVPYPNPFSNELYVNVGIDVVNTTIKIYSVTDGLLKQSEQFKMVNGVIKLDVSKLKMGIYSIHVVKGDSESVYKVIKQ